MVIQAVPAAVDMAAEVPHEGIHPDKVHREVLTEDHPAAVLTENRLAEVHQAEVQPVLQEGLPHRDVPQAGVQQVSIRLVKDQVAENLQAAAEETVHPAGKNQAPKAVLPAK